LIEENEEVEDDIDDVFRAPRIQPKATGLTLIKKQFIGLLRKRLSHAKRNRKGFISQIVLPALFVCLAMVSAMLRPPVGQLPSLKLTTTDAIPQPNNMFFADARKSPSGKRLADTFVNPPGVGRSLMFCIYCVFRHVISVPVSNLLELSVQVIQLFLFTLDSSIRSVCPIVTQ
jgi:hypothetical protein